ncbi:LAFA_0G07052g1_1 [Lachancea sp. 'fantastica']|nr:LAFA_0G07052g1_1 [Lachancea sp. 'fantastica']
MVVAFHPYQERYSSFLQTYHIQGKRCSWPYRVIPTKAMAQMGFEFTPKFKGEALSRDCVRCNFCGSDSFDFHDCRSKPMTATLTKVLENHLQTQETCLYSRLKFILVRSFWKNEPIDWSQHQILGDPYNMEMIRLRQWTFKEGWIHESNSRISSKSMAEAGLLRYDLGLSSPELQEEHPDATYCIYCSKIIGSWEADDDPQWEHFVCSNGGQCHFFEIMSNSATLAQMKTRFDEEGFGSNDKFIPSLDYYETFGSQLLKYEQDAAGDEFDIKRGRPRSRGSNEMVIREAKKRGRPRKEKPAEEVATDEGSVALSNEGIPVTKRKRGRPRKVADSASTEIKQKRPRGRPRKDTISSTAHDLMPKSMSPPSTGNLKTSGSSGSALTAASSAGDTNSLTPSILPETSCPAPSDGSDVEGDQQQIERPSTATELDNSPKRKVRLRQNQRLTSTEDQDIDSDTNSTKSIVFNFNNPSPKGKSEARNPIIDDSFDAFSFSAHGNSEFVIPESAFQIKKSSVLQPLDEKSFGASTLPQTGNESPKEESPIQKLALKENALDDIDMNVEMSDDSSGSSPLSKASTPVGSPARSLPPPEKHMLDKRRDSEVNKTELNSASGPKSISRIDVDTLSLVAKKPDNDELSPRSADVDTESSGAIMETTEQPSPINKYNNRLSPALKQTTLAVEGESARPLSTNTAVTTRETPKENVSEPKIPEDGPTQQGTPARERPPASPTSANISSSAAELRNSFSKVDEERVLLADYFRQLLRYINVNDMSLSNEVDGDLSFFVQHMPPAEKKLTFTAWIDLKQSELVEEFERDYRIKVAKLEEQFQLAKSFFENMDNDETLLRIAEQFGALDRTNNAL